MDNFFTKRSITWVAVILLAAALIFLLRGRISSWMSFGPDFSPDIDVNDALPSGSAPDDTQKSGGETAELPIYEGRDPQEVRPDPKEVAVFGDEQREKIYADIRMQGSAVKEKPEFITGWLQVGILKKVIGDYEGARDAWEYAGIIRPENSVTFANLGELYWKYLPDFPRSEKNFLISIKNKKSDPAVYISLSELYSYSYTSKSDLADDVLLEGIAANPDSTNLMRTLAYLYERQGNFVSALEWWQKVLAGEPADANVVSTIAELKKKTGN